MTDENSIKEIDVKDILYSKNPKIAKWIPGFAIKILKKIIHEDFVNDLIRNYGQLIGFDFSEGIIKGFNVTVKVEGENNLPDNGRFIFASNHPLGGFDGHILMYLIGKKYGHTSYKFLVNDILMGLKNLKSVFIPINMHGRQENDLVAQVDEAYKSDTHIMSFPAGMVSRKIKGQVVDMVWQKSFITKAKKYKRDIIPIHVSGGNSKFFYRLSNIRTKLGIKANIEMLFLIHESIKHQNKTFTVKFGEPIPWQTFDNSKRPIEWAKWVKEKAYKLDGVNSIPL